MSRDLIVRNNRLIKKPLSVNDLIYGSTYAYGTLDEYDRMVEFDKIGDGPVVVYDCDHIGRGVQIEELSKKQVKLSLPLPATTYDINVLYYLARRAAELWGNNVIIDPDWETRISLDDIDTPKKADYGSSIKILASWPSSDRDGHGRHGRGVRGRHGRGDGPAPCPPCAPPFWPCSRGRP